LPTSAECLTSRMAQLYLSGVGLEDWSGGSSILTV
jgi:hypothetical protein